MEKKKSSSPSDRTAPVPEKKDYVVFDLEATGLNPWYGHRATCICARDSTGEEFQEVEEDEQKLICSFLEWLKKRSPENHLLITKNGRMFDVPFILTRMVHVKDLKPESGFFILDYEHLDLHELTDKWVSLNDMAKLFRCTTKSGSGKQAIRLWQEKRYQKLKAYCMQDVKTTEEVFLKWRRL